MSRVCILTDSTVQFPVAEFPGQEHVHILPFQIRIGEQVYPDHLNLSTPLLLSPAGKSNPLPSISPPTVDDFREIYLSLNHNYQEIVVALSSSHLTQTVSRAREAAATVKTSAPIHIIDTQTTSIGLGILVQRAGEAIQRGLNSNQIKRLIRGLQPRIYTAFCLQSLQYMQGSGHLDPAQAVVAEMLGFIPFYVIENGFLAPVQKARNSRHLFDILFEFITEFDTLDQIALIQGFPAHETETRHLRERISQEFTKTEIHEFTIGPSLAVMLGPRSLGLVLMEPCRGEL